MKFLEVSEFWDLCLGTYYEEDLRSRFRFSPEVGDLDVTAVVVELIGPRKLPSGPEKT